IDFALFYWLRSKSPRTIVLSKLNKLTEHFLALERMQQSAFELQLAAINVFSERNLLKNYRAEKRALQKSLKESGESEFLLFKAQARLAEIEDLHYVRQKRRVHDISIQEAAHLVDCSYYLQRLDQACSMLDRQHILQANYELALSEDWFNHLRQHLAKQPPIIQLYLFIFQMLNDEEQEAHFQELKDGLQEHHSDISPPDLTTIYQFAVNYCARKIRAGREPYVEEALQLYITAIEAGWFIINDELSPWTYANVVKLFLRQQKFEEAKAFIHQYLPLLPDRFRDNAFHYNLAELYYYTNDYEQAQEHLIQVAYEDLNYYLGARVLLAKIYWQTEAEDALSSLLAAFIMFLQRNKQLSKNLKNTYLNFCKILARILRTPTEKRAALKSTITETSPLTDRDWLLNTLST
ncbi:MAG: hypothetical protein AAFN81_33270, partial [Bacteroidota bacterium]